jgi:hypothetical protein
MYKQATESTAGATADGSEISLIMVASSSHQASMARSVLGTRMEHF